MVAITGQVPYSAIGTDAFQEVDAYGLTIPITKHNFIIRKIVLFVIINSFIYNLTFFLSKNILFNHEKEIFVYFIFI